MGLKLAIVNIWADFVQSRWEEGVFILVER